MCIRDRSIAAPKLETKSKAERLRELKQLFEEKLITESEYQKEREKILDEDKNCLLYTSPSPRDRTRSRMPSSA